MSKVKPSVSAEPLHQDSVFILSSPKRKYDDHGLNSHISSIKLKGEKGQDQRGQHDKIKPTNDDWVVSALRGE